MQRAGGRARAAIAAARARRARRFCYSSLCHVAPRRARSPARALARSAAPSASSADVKAAYKRRALGAHPDKEGGSEEAFKALGEAYDVLRDAAERASHDADVRDWEALFGAPARRGP